MKMKASKMLPSLITLSSTPGPHMIEGSDLHMHTMSCTQESQINKINIVLKHLGQWDVSWGKGTLLSNPGHLNSIHKGGQRTNFEKLSSNTHIHAMAHSYHIILYTHSNKIFKWRWNKRLLCEEKQNLYITGLTSWKYECSNRKEVTM